MAASGEGASPSGLKSSTKLVHEADPSCTKIFDAFMYCMTPTNQLASYYRFGIADWCPEYLNKWVTCIRLKTKMPEEAAAVRRRALEREQLGHLWDFKPPYASEAIDMYGSSVSVRENSAEKPSSSMPVA